MIPKILPVRLINKDGGVVKIVMRCPVPELLDITEYDGTLVQYERRFALIVCGETPIIKEVFYYESDRQRLG